MGFLPFPSDDEFSPEAAAAAAAFQAEHPGPISNLDRTLLGFGMGLRCVPRLVRGSG